MFLPIFIAILMGLISPSNTDYNGDGTVYVSAAVPDPEEPGTDPCIDAEGNTCPDSGNDGTGGDNGHVHPPRPKP